MRLTIKDKGIRNNFNAEYAKLADLEDVEDELGIELHIMFKALKDGVWYYDENGQLLHDYVWLENNYVAAGTPDKLSFSIKTFLRWKILLFEDYGKTWASTKEELEND